MQKIAIAGASGLIGSKIADFFKSEGWHVYQISRRSSVKDAKFPLIHWDPERGILDQFALEGFDVVINLAGESVGQYWDQTSKEKILQSRLRSTALLSRTIAALKDKPKLFVCASAIGYYGNHQDDTILSEESPSGNGFLAEVCQRWEMECQPAKDAWVRVVHLRFGVVLSPKGGALAKMLVPFKLGIGGALGSGRQMMSWISLDEIPWIIRFIINNNHIQGPVNAVAPHAVSNAQFSKVLGKVLKRPSFLPVPGFMVRLLFGQMGEEMLLSGCHVVPKRLLEYGYTFLYPHLEIALNQEMK